MCLIKATSFEATSFVADKFNLLHKKSGVIQCLQKVCFYTKQEVDWMFTKWVLSNETI